ncbi:MAG: SMI1/KNR4 family protein [Myxococcales bacterium]|nr:SMI1/KNR4 family protein [Myxococcales bacterium]
MSIVGVFARYVAWLEVEAPLCHANLAPPATSDELADLERTLGCALPADVTSVLRVHNGQKQAMLSNRLVEASVTLPTLTFLSTHDIAAIWTEWSELRAQTSESVMADLDAGCRVFRGARGKVKELYTSPGWIPLWADPTRPDYIGLDLDPEAQGTSGQIINFGRNEDRHFVAAPDFGALFEILVDEVEAGAWPASEMPYGKDKTVPWLGSPKESFFEALYRRFEARG